MNLLPRYILDIYGAKGAEWLERLPALLREWARRWSLSVLSGWWSFEDHGGGWE